jgi:hypothetical protein
MVASPFVESYVIMVGVVFADTCKEKQSATVTKYGREHGEAYRKTPKTKHPADLGAEIEFRPMQLLWRGNLLLQQNRF